MPRFARIFFILLASAAGSCSSGQLAQKQVERKKTSVNNLPRPTSLVYAPHSRRSFQQWSIAIWQ